VASWVIDVVHAFGYAGVAVLLVLENLSPPIPSELILPLVGFLTGQGRLAFPLAVAAATAGSVAGALILYGLGRCLGRERLRRFVGRFGHWLFLEPSDLEEARRWFERHGGEAVLICRLVPFARSAISIPAGIERMAIWRFVVYTTVGSGLFNAALIGLGWWLGAQWELVQRYTAVLEWAVWIAIATAVGWFIWRRTRRRGGASAPTATQSGEG
jgi:membrane protein DedA with SNARE-associated domain